MSLSNTDGRPCGLAAAGIKVLNEQRNEIAADRLEPLTMDAFRAPEVQGIRTRTLPKCPEW